MGKLYEAKWAKIGNSSSYRLQVEFFKENPHFVECGAMVQVIDQETVLLRGVKTKEEE